MLGQLGHLIADSKRGYRVYELMALRRPADVLRYIRIISRAKLPEPVRERLSRDKLHSIRDAEAPQAIRLDFFSLLFRWCWDRAEPEDEAWLRFFEDRLLHRKFRALFLRVVASQRALAESRNPLIQYELQTAAAGIHPCDWEVSIPHVDTPADYQSPTLIESDKRFLGLDTKVLARADVESVSYGGPGAIAVLGAICTEQLRRAEARDVSPYKALMIHALINGAKGGFDPNNANLAWCKNVIYMDEGLRYGDLRIWEDSDANIQKIYASIDPVIGQGRDLQIFVAGMRAFCAVGDKGWTVAHGSSVGVSLRP